MYNLNSKGKNILFVYKIKSVIYLPVVLIVIDLI